LGDELTAFVSYDERLSAAARNLGLPVVAPNDGSETDDQPST
jgi:nicotinamidase-related amidase